MTDVIEATKPSTAIALIVQQTPVVVLTDEAKRNEFYAHIQAEVDAFEPDISTDKGRKAIASLAYKIARTKTAIDAAGKELNDEARQKINAVDAERRAVKEHFDALAKSVRAPLTEWEEAEEKRVEFIDNMIAMFRSARSVEMGEDAASIRSRGAAIYQTALDAETFQERLDEAQREKDETVGVLKAAMDRAVVAEAEAAELARLRAENEARELAEREKAEADRIERERVEAERRTEEARADAEKAEAERVAAAADQARRDAEEKAENDLKAAEAKREYARQIIDHIKQVGLGMIGGKPYAYGILIHELDEKIVINDELGDLQDEVRTIRDATRATLIASMERSQERAAQEEQAEADRKAEQARIAREQDKAHRTKVMKAAKEAIMSCGADEETAKKIVLAIKAGEVPNITIGF